MAKQTQTFLVTLHLQEPCSQLLTAAQMRKHLKAMPIWQTVDGKRVRVGIDKVTIHHAP